MTRTALLATVAAFAAAPLAAQHQHQAPAPPPRPAAAQPAPPASAACPMGMMGEGGMMMPGMDSMMGPLHGAMAYAPRRLLERKAALRLDADQESRLAGIGAVSQPQHDSAMAAAERHGQELQAALAAPAPDPAVVASHFESLHGAMGVAHAIVLRAALEARAVLTSGQRSLMDVRPADRSGRMTPMMHHEQHHPPRRP